MSLLTLPLSPGQRGLWFLHRLHPDSPAYHLALASRIRSNVAIEAPAGAIRDLFQAQVDRHEALRTTFPLAGEEPVQRVAAPSDHAELAFEEIDATAWDEAMFRARLEEAAWKPFDLENGPLFRVQVFHRAGGERVLLVVVHHIVVDFGSFAGMLAGAGEGNAPQYRDFLAWQEEVLASAEGERLWSFWREELAGLPVLELPVDRPRRTGVPERGGCRWREIGPGVVRELKRLARSEGATLYVALLAGFQALLSRYTGQTDFAVGSPAAGRPKGFARTMGYFTNPLPIRADLSGGPSYRELVVRARKRASEALDHQHLPLPLLVERLRSEGREGGLFRTLFVFHRDPSGLEGMVGFALGEGGGLLRWGDLELEPLALPPRAAQFDVTLAAGERRGALGLQLVYDADLFDGPTAGRWLEHLAVLLEGAAFQPEMAVSELPLLTVWERQQVLVEVNEPEEVVLPWPRLEEGFERQAERTPGAVALIDGEQRITYRELRDRAAALAEHLRRLGVGPEQVVGVRMPRTAGMVAALLGILKSGAAYVPLDPSYPEERIAFLLEDAGTRWVVGPGGEVLPPLPVGGRAMGEGGRGGEDREGAPSPARGGRVEDARGRGGEGALAYLIYTSGSTGRPKGVAIGHASAVRLVAWAGRTYSREELSGVLASTSINFDLSIFEIFVPLSFGGTVILAENALSLPALPAAGEVTLVNTVPSAIAALLDLGPLPPSVKTVNLAGEPLRRSLADRVLATGVRLRDLYGPSEDTTYSTGSEVRAGDAGEPAIGGPVAGSRAYVLDAGLHLLPVGVPGELCLGGGGLARGYLNRPDLTAERFVPSPFGDPGGRLYRTGDLARWRPDGQLEYLGRLDHQVKIRGFRIEPGEVEAALLAHPGVREAAVVAREGALVAYVSEEGTWERGRLARTELAAYLRSRLPAPFVPSAFVVLPALPLTPNGKVDRKALPAPERVGEGDVEAPVGPVEELLAGIWAEVLGRDRIGRHESFFEMGGHSLLAFRALARISRRLGVDLPVACLFDAPTIAALAGEISAVSGGAAAPPLRPVLVPHEGREDLPLSFAQRRLWFLDRLQPGSAAYNLPGAVRLAGGLEVAALAAALGGIQRRHEVLRTVFPLRDGEPVQAVQPPAPVPMPVVDLAGLPFPMSRSEAERLAVEEARTPFDLARGPVWRASLFRLGEAEHLLVVNLHHIAADGWSLGPLLREMAALYEGSPVPDLPVQYVDYAIWQRGWMRGEALERRLDAWRGRLAGLPVLELTTDLPRPAVRDPRGGVRALELSPGLAREIERLARGEGATLFMTLLAAFQVLLARYTGEDVIPVGSPVANRRPLEVEPLIGFFVNTLVLAGRLGDDPPFRSYLGRVREECLGAYAHQDLPFERLVEELHPDRDLSRNPLFQVAFQTEEPLPSARSRELSLEVRPIDNGTSKIDLTLSVSLLPEGRWLARAEHASIFEPATVERLLGHWRNLLAGVAADPAARLSDLPLLSEPERVQLLGSARAEGVTAEERCLHHLFEERARLSPEALAVVLDADEIVYGELDARANRLARHLLDLELRPEAPVAVLLGRSPDLVVAMLAVLKSGGAYLPLDPSWPRERHELLLADSGAAVLVSRTALAGSLGNGSVIRILLDADAGTIAARSADAPGTTAGPRGLAYLIYTSGSSGRPKPVGVGHAAAASHCEAVRRAYGLGSGDRVLAFASPAFDASLEQILSGLAAGATVVLRGQEVWAVRDLARRIGELRLSVVNLPTAYWGLWLREGEDLEAVGPGLRLVIAGGEEMPAEAVRLWRASPLGGIRLLNAYGPTEAVITATLDEAGREEGDPRTPFAPIGQPLPGRSAHVLDGHGGLLPPGLPGELALGGILARGYPGSPALTAERFVPDPFATGPGARLYRTGDLARRRPDGGLELLGRIDRQVKIRGFRVEPGEVEAVLARHPGVAQAAVLVHGRNAGDRGLVAFVVAAGGGLSLPELRVWLGERLPSYLLPSLAVLPELPLTPNGKVDRAALARRIPELESGARQEAGSAAPRAPVEELLAGIWAELLGLEHVGIDDDFFALGGHSLLATRLVARVSRAFGADLPVSAVFRTPTVAALAEEVSSAMGREREVPPLRPVPRPRGEREGLPLSFAQRRLWFLDQLQPGSAAYNLSGAVRLAGRLDVAAFGTALGALQRRHEVLRTVFRVRDREPVQVVQNPAPVLLPVIDLGSLPAPVRPAEAERLAGAEARTPFDLARGPVWRARLVRLDRDEHLLIANLHHIAADGWSMGPFLRELAALYEGSPLPELPVQYADYAVWQRGWMQGEVLERQLGWWRERLAGLPVLELPAERPRPAVRDERGASRFLVISPGLAGEVDRLARGERATLFMTLLAAFQTLLARITGEDAIPVGSPVANRRPVEVEPLIGFFVNTLVLVGRLGDDPPFRGFLARVREACLGAYAHQDLPFERLVEELHPDRELSQNPLFQVGFQVEEAPPLARAGELSLEVHRVENGTSKLDLTLSVSLLPDGGWLARAEHAASLFEAAAVERLLGHWRNLLAGAAAVPQARLSDLPLLGEAERRQILVEFNAWNGGGEGPPASVFELVEERAARDPGSPAVSWPGGRLAWGELWSRAGGLAAELWALGVGPEVPVGVHAGLSPELVLGFAAVLASGGAYVPLDPSYPEDRLAFIAREPGMPVLLTTSVDRPAWIPAGVRVLRLDVEDDGWNAPPPGRPGAEPEGLAYVIYTSGSTGRPKGVQATHRGLSSLVGWYRRLFAVTEQDRGALVAAPAFDASIAELALYLAAGAGLHVPDEDTRLSPEGLLSWLDREGITICFLPTPLAEQVLELLGRGLSPPSALRVLMTGGDRLQRAPVRPLPFSLFNVYGPAENSVLAAQGEVAAAAPGPPPIGRPAPYVRAFVLGRHGETLPPNVPGELFLGGDGVSRGYLGRPDLTAERFLPDPFGPPGGRLYRTGDRVRWRPDGRLDFLGRLDHQVKIRGVRIELGEIEATLAGHSGVREAAAVARDGGPGESPRLIAGVVPVDGAAAGPSLAPALRAFLRERLPEPMVPSAWIWLDALPVTPNGKIDRAALARLAPVQAPEEGSEPPRGLAEETLAAIWTEVLGLERVGRSDSFFDLGGHSLLAAQVVSRVRQAFGREIPLRALFEEPTLAGLARRIGEAHGDRAIPPLVPTEVRPAPLSFAQQRLWFLAQLDPSSAVYNIPSSVLLRGRLDAAALERSLAGIVRRHEALRTTFQVVGNEPAQVVSEPGDLFLPLVDLRVLGGQAGPEALRLVREDALRPFDLQRGPVFRPLLLRLGEEEHRLLATLHHIAGDGWSVGVLVRELTALYRGFLEGWPSPLPELPVQYSDFAVWQRRWLAGPVLARELAFWREQLRGLPPGLDLATDRPRPPLQTFRGASRPVSLGADLTRALRALARGEGATLFMVLLSGFQALLGRISGQDDLAVGTPVAGRGRVELEGLIGFFVNTLVLRGDLGGDPGFRDLLARTRERSLAAHAHQDLPFEKLVEELKPERSLSRPPLFQVLLVLQNTPREPFALPGLEALPLAGETGTAKLELQLSLEETEGGISGSLEYNRDLFDAPTMDRLLAHFGALLAAAASDPGRRLSELALLSPAERHQLLVEWNPREDQERARPVHALFEEQAARRPAAPAVACGDDRLTYGELDRRAGTLARRLRRLGVGPEQRVAICLERSVGMVVAILGALKAGGAYVPLDPGHPAERQAYVLEDSGARVLITNGELAGRLPVLPGLPVVLLEEGGEEDGPVSADEVRPVHTANAAYVIYTSGSTGRPKGVVVAHAEVARLFSATRCWFGFGADDVWTLFHSFAFDFSVWELWGALAHGGRLVIVPWWVSRSPEAFLQLLAEERVTVLSQTPSAFRQLVQVEGDLPAPLELALRFVVFGGEALDLAALAPWFERRSDLQPRLINMYGITETTVHVTYRPICREDLALAPASPIGVPIPDLRLHLLDRRLELVPLGVPGEICVGGDGLARGYLGRPDLTAERFVPDPFGGPGDRLYRSGDLARRLPDGDVEHLGRVDFQVKIRGFRIEPGEIEAALAAHPAVREGAVLVREDRPGDRRLVAYVVAKDGDLRTEELRGHLRERLPEHMVPAAFVVLDALPLTANGKLDRRALPAPEGSRAKAALVAPRTETEEAIATAWRAALGLEAVGVDDNFFDLGGHSLLVVQVHRELAPRFPGLAVVDLFRYPTISALAQFLSREKVEQISLQETRERAESRTDRARRQRELRRQVRSR